MHGFSVLSEPSYLLPPRLRDIAKEKAEGFYELQVVETGVSEHNRAAAAHINAQDVQEPYKLKPDKIPTWSCHKVSPLAKELLAIASCWEREGQFSLRV